MGIMQPTTTRLRRFSKRDEVKNAILHWIGEQKLQPGDQILGQNALAAELDTTVVTVHKALSELAQQDVLHRINGRGTFVGPLPARPVVAKTVFLVMPGEHLDQPEYNPTFWPHAQQLVRAFLDVADRHLVFSIRSIPGDPDPAGLAREFAGAHLIVFHYSQQPARLVRHLIRTRLAPVAIFGQSATPYPCLRVDHDLAEGTRGGVSHLIEMGYRRIALICSSESWGELALQGYRAALTSFGLPFEAQRILRLAGYGQADGYCGASLLLSHVQDCDAIFVDSDVQALGVLDYLRREGRRVPEDIGVMGYDGLDAANRQPPYLTTVDSCCRERIQAAVDWVSEHPCESTPDEVRLFAGRVLPGRTARQV